MNWRDAARRLAALEAALRPAAPVPLPWDHWDALLTEDEKALLWALAERGGRELAVADRGWLCRDDAEAALFASLVAKANGPLPPPWTGWEGYGLDLYLDDMEL